jgi:hypothetical protein
MQVVIEGPLARSVQGVRRVLRLPRLHPLRQFGDAFQVLLILDGLRLPSGNNLVQQRGHLLVVGRVVEVLLDNLFADVVLDGLGNRVLVSLQSPELSGDGIGDAGLHDQLHQTHIVEGRNLPRFVGLDVGVDQMPHVGFIRFEVQTLATGLANNLADIEVLGELLLDTGDVVTAVSCLFQLVGNVGVGTHEGRGRLVESGALRFPFLQVRRNLRVAAKVSDVLQFAFGWRDWLAQQGDGFQSIVETFLS